MEVTGEILQQLTDPEVLLPHGVGNLPNLGAEEKCNDAFSAFLRAHAPAS